MSHPALKIRSFEVIELVWETPDVFTLRLRPKSDEDAFSFIAGQWVYLHLLNDDGSTWARAAFSVLSSPNISRDKIELGIKVYGDFTKRAGGLTSFDEVGIQGPFGVFTLDEGDEPLVMLAAGIGVTPLLCLTEEALSRNPDRKVTFFYSNKTVEDIAYFERIRELEKKYTTFKSVLTLTRATYEGWKGERGRVNGEMLKKHVHDLLDRKYYMCGPNEFMDDIRTFLDAEGLNTKDCLKQERFD